MKKRDSEDFAWALKPAVVKGEKISYEWIHQSEKHLRTLVEKLQQELDLARKRLAELEETRK